MGTVTLLIGFHNHQPQGNFEHVFQQGYEDCYGRILDLISRHPTIRVSLHHSGPLIEWLEANQPAYFDALRDLVAAERVELLGGGFYEPMLSVLPPRDAHGQLVMMADFLEQRCGVRPRGMWLAERVWEPDLPRLIRNAGYEYTLLDDTHFLAVGMRRPMSGYYLTDKAAHPLSVFPIAKEMRYAIPFKPAHEAIELLLRMADEAGDEDLVLTYGDDGEKFGMWPGTKKWLWEDGWADSFFSLLAEHSDRIKTATFSEILRRDRPKSRTYLPTASYHEMGEWALPAESQPRFEALHQMVKDSGNEEDWAPFVRGGIWQSFMAKYPEADFMHKRMCYVSGRVQEASLAATKKQKELVENARVELYKGQCNCAYWHGLFGGLYLANLRSAMHTHLVRADRLAGQILDGKSKTNLKVVDIDADLLDEVVMTNDAIAVIASPERGGALLAIDDRKRDFCVNAVLARRPESYHAKVRKLAAEQNNHGDGGDAPQSIHDIANLKEDNLDKALIYDRLPKLSFLDHLWDAEMELDHLKFGAPKELADFATEPFDILKTNCGKKATLDLGAVLPVGETDVEAWLKKSFTLGNDGLEVVHQFKIAMPIPSAIFATELTLALPSGPHPDCQILLKGDAIEEKTAVTQPGVYTGISQIEMVDPLTPLTIAISLSQPATVVQIPIDTVSQSESGYEKVYQGTSFYIIRPCQESFESRLALQLR
jgi:4-alpha-glucanotransferase